MSAGGGVRAGDQPGFADAAIFNMVRDDGVVHGVYDLDGTPALQAAIASFGALPDVQAWIDAWEAREV